MKPLANVVAEVSERLGDAGQTKWSDQEVQDKIRAGYDQFVIRTGILWVRTNTGMDDVAHQALYTVPTDLIQIERVSYRGYRIEPISRRQAMTLDPQFQSTEGQVIAWVFDGDGLRVLRKIRIPAGVGTAGDTQLEYQRRMVFQATVLDPSELPDYMDKYARFYALAKCYEREGEGQDLTASDHYMLRFEMGVTLALDRKEKAAAIRTRIIGGRDGMRPRKPARPVLPSNFPQD